MDATAAAMKERHAAGLAELAELGLAVARNLAHATLQADTAEDKAKLASALHRISRSLRQTYALEAKLSAEAVRERAAAERQAAQAQANAKKARVRPALVRLIWDEHEEDEAEALEEELDGVLYCGALTPEDLAAPDEALIARIAAELGLTTPPTDAAATPVAAAEVEPPPPP